MNILEITAILNPPASTHMTAYRRADSGISASCVTDYSAPGTCIGYYLAYMLQSISDYFFI